MQLIKIIFESEGENNYEKLHNQLINHGFNEWNMDQFSLNLDSHWH